MAIQGLDRDLAPPPATAKQMLDLIGGRWWNVYIGGPESAGRGWNPDVVKAYARQGIERFMLTYVGRQWDGPLTRAQGRTDALDALRIAKSYGYEGEFPLCLDVELRTYESAPAKAVEYTRAWCATVRDQGTRPGVYANPGPLKAMATGKVPCEFVWVASWVAHSAEPHDPHSVPQMPPGLWRERGRRAWQYAGAFNGKRCEVLGLNVDINVADVGCLAKAPGAKRRRPPKAVKRPPRAEAPKSPQRRPSPLRSLIEDVRRHDAATEKAWDRLEAYGARRRKLLERAEDKRDRDDDLGQVTDILLRIEGSLETLVSVEKRELALQEGGSAGGPANGPAAYEPAKPPENGRPLRLDDLTDAELRERIERLDHALDRSRVTLMRRYVSTERELAELGHRPDPSGPAPLPDRPPPRPDKPGQPRPPKRTPQIETLQRALNRFTGRYLEGVAPLGVDGDKGRLTRRRVRRVKWYLGYTGEDQQSAAVTSTFLRRVRQPRSPRYSPPGMLTRGAARRRKQHEVAKKAVEARNGVAVFEGEPVAAWMLPYVQWARAHGWHGRILSGYRTPEESEQICLGRCGKPSCPGNCAGRASNHSGKDKPRGALDVTDEGTFAAAMRSCPYSPRIFNSIGASDPNHFSATGN